MKDGEPAVEFVGGPDLGAKDSKRDSCLPEPKESYNKDDKARIARNSSNPPIKHIPDVTLLNGPEIGKQRSADSDSNRNPNASDSKRDDKHGGPQG